MRSLFIKVRCESGRDYVTKLRYEGGADDS